MIRQGKYLEPDNICQDNVSLLANKYLVIMSYYLEQNYAFQERDPPSLR